MLPKRFVVLILLLIGALIPFWISKPSLVDAHIQTVSVDKSYPLPSSVVVVEEVEGDSKDNTTEPLPLVHLSFPRFWDNPASDKEPLVVRRADEQNDPLLSVVINEIAWAGTKASPDHEWIELYNNSPSEIDLSGWTLSISDSIEIPLSGLIAAHDYYLLEREDDDNTVSDIVADLIYTGELNDEGQTLILYDNEDQEVDKVNQEGGSWPAGNGEDTLFDSPFEFSTMERISPTLSTESNWATNDGIHQNGQDADGNALNGSPKEANSIRFTEADDSCAGATEITFNENNQSSDYFSLLRTHSDEDLFKFEVPDEYTTIEAYLTPNFDINLYFECIGTLGFSYELGQGDESSNVIRYNVGIKTGWYYLKVDNQSSSYSGQPYQLNVQLETINVSSVETLIFYNHMRFSEAHGIGAASRVMQKLTQFAKHPQVEGTIIQLDQYPDEPDDPDVRGAYESWDTTSITSTLSNVEAANIVVDAVEEVMRESLNLQQFPRTKYVVLVGDDQQIPFRRLDVNPFRVDPSWRYESQYQFNSGDTPIGAALWADQTLTDNNYGSYLDYPYRELPELAVGRLVGEPEDILTMLQTFRDRDGQISLATGAVTGHDSDFLADAAQSQCQLYEDAGLSMSCLMGSNYTGEALYNAYLRNQPDLASNNWHTTHQSLLTPGGSPGNNSLDAQSIFDFDEVDLKGHLWSVMGCQSGLVMPDDSQYNISLAQALNAQGVTYIGNTGWAWGSDTMGFSERIYQLFTERLIEEPDITIGEALRDAKRLYFEESVSTEFSKVHYHQKVMTEMTLFGLPMLRYQFPESTSPATQEASPITISRTITSHPDADVLPSLDESTELQVDASLPVDFHPLEFGIGNLAHQEVQSERGPYYEGEGGATTSQVDLPVLPQQEPIDITTAFGEAHGIIWLGGTYTTSQGYEPLINIAAPFGYEANLERLEVELPSLYPHFPAMISSLESRDGRTTERLVYISGQFDSQIEQLRLFTEMSVLIGLSSNSDIVPPILGEPIANMGANSLDFSIPITDSSGIYKAYLTYTEVHTQSTTGTWQSVELTPTGDDLYSQEISFTHPITYIVQVMDNAGNVARIPYGESATLIGSVTLQGRPDEPEPSWEVPIRLTLTSSHDENIHYELVVTTNDMGTFMMKGIEPGTYDIRLKNSHTLRKTQTITLSAGNNHIDLGTLLEGDANDDNMVNIIDFSTLAAAFGTCEGEPAFNPQTDFNEDGCIGILDFSLLASNFGEMGDP